MSGIEWTDQLRFVVALALGFLIGLERERADLESHKRVLAGVRTYSLVSLYGFGCAWLWREGVVSVLPVGLLTVGAFTIVQYLVKIHEGRGGWTSQVAALLTFIVGALALLSHIWVAMALGVISALLLSEKADIERNIEMLDRTEFLAVLKFLIVTVIVLPVLPNQGYTRFELNPRHIWQVVVLVSSIGFVGYFLCKKLGDRAGLWLSGLLGGIVSSTAVSVAVGRIAQRVPATSTCALQASLLASSVMYARILVLVWILNPAFLPFLWWRLMVLAAVGLVLALATRERKPHAEDEEHVQTLENPFEIRPAVVFATLFVMLTVITVFVREAFGSAGLYALSAVVGVTDIDPFVLSLVRGSAQAMVAQAIIIAMMSNTAIKGVYFGVLARPTRRATAWRYGLWTLLHLPLVLLPMV